MSECAPYRIVTFRIGRDLFGVPIANVERVLGYGRARRIPGSADWIVGVIDYDGRVVPVVDLGRRFGMQDGAPSAPTRVMVLSACGDWMAIGVDAVLDVRGVEGDGLERPPAALQGGSMDATLGMARRGDELVVVLDVSRLLAAADTERAGTGDAITAAG